MFDDTGKSYLDMLAGLGVSCLGYGHPRLVQAIQEQAARLLHVSNLYYSEPGARLAQALVESSFAERVFFCNSGTEANEAAIKMVRRRDADRKEIVAAFRSFHGRTLGALAATGQPELQEGFGPMPGGFVHVEYGDVPALAGAVGAKTAAVILEPIIGEGGVLVAPDGYLRAARKICDDAGALLILDEVQCGWGRTGLLWAYEHEDVTPDVLTAAKGLAGGLRSERCSPPRLRRKPSCPALTAPPSEPIRCARTPRMRFSTSSSPKACSRIAGAPVSDCAKARETRRLHAATWSKRAVEA